MDVDSLGVQLGRIDIAGSELQMDYMWKAEMENERKVRIKTELMFHFSLALFSKRREKWVQM
jgi:hypothetical protein